MGKKFFVVGILSILFAGCATTQQPTAVNQLQIKVAQLERKIEDRDQEISDLKYEVENLSNQTQNTSSVSTTESMPSSTSETVDRVSDASMDTKHEGMIRVSATPVQVQKALKNAGYYNGTIDGKIGPNTQRAIEKFQKDHSLTADGVIGKKTWQELKSYLE